PVPASHIHSSLSPRRLSPPCSPFLLLLLPHPPPSPLFPYTTLFRSGRAPCRPIAASASSPRRADGPAPSTAASLRPSRAAPARSDRKSTRLNSSHVAISYAVFCLKKKKKKHQDTEVETRHNRPRGS